MSALDFERETLRNLAGPELFMQTGLDLLEPAELAGIQGGFQPFAAQQVTVPGGGGGVTVPTDPLSSDLIPFTRTRVI